jgi:hypothetical protein
MSGCDGGSQKTYADAANAYSPDSLGAPEPMEKELESGKAMRFHEMLENLLSARGIKREEFYDAKSEVERRVLDEYGAMFLAAEGVVPPPVCIFTSEEQVKKFQDGLSVSAENFGEAKIELQTKAMTALLDAKKQAEEKGLSITPRDGAEAARRSYEDTVRLWNSRFEPACEYWQKEKRLTADEVARLKSLPIYEQVGEVLKLESRRIYFNTFFNNSILYSVAPPGTSQHLSLLAFDAVEFQNEKVRKILGEHGWFRTVKNDAPHFTFLGLKKDELKSNGLKKVKTGDGEFWVPNI